jgi:hypothetical protein
LVSSIAMGDPAEKLFDEAIKLPPQARRAFALRVLASVANEGGESAPPTRGVTASWETIAALRGVVHLGGNAVEDCDRLYDD